MMHSLHTYLVHVYRRECLFISKSINCFLRGIFKGVCSSIKVQLLLTNFICFYAYNTLIYTHPPSPPYPLFSGDLGTLSLGIPYHTCNARKVARETTVSFFCFVLFFFFSRKFMF